MKARLDDRLFEALKGEMTPKFLATKDENQVPNVVPIISIQPYDRETLIFGNFLMWKTEKNLRKNDQVSVTVITEQLFGATIRGVFKGFQKVGKYAELISSLETMRYNSYTGIRNAGSIEIVDISEPFQLNKLEILSGFLQSKVRRVWAKRYSQGKRIMHPLVQGLYGRAVAVKVLSFIDDQGYPYAVPVMSLQSAAPDVLVFSKKQMLPYMIPIKENARVAVSVITMEPVAFQVKGTYKDMDGNWGAVLLNEAFHASPPHVGKKIA